ncbi:MAG: 3-phosphoshikimate 1-carboxyvinyltransferase [Spirochaetes bacterium]|nr:3-phosphoshikimate 1-carboxyvinyltransferase [Spirochaetota bacterium]
MRVTVYPKGGAGGFNRGFTPIVRIPASKSHTIRQIIIASLAEAPCEIIHPLDSLDTASCIAVCRGLGAQITEHRAHDPLSPNPPDKNGKKLVRLEIQGGVLPPGAGGEGLLDVGNSGTTLFFAIAAAALQPRRFVFTGDRQTQARSAGPLLDALASLGVQVSGNAGCLPITVAGPYKGGKARLPCPTSQYLSALLLAAPLAKAGSVTEIEIPLLNERPYIEMTLSYLKSHGISYESDPDFSRFVIPGGGVWKAFSASVPGDFSSAAFPAAAAAIGGSPVTILGLDPKDSQGDKAFFDILEKMGCYVKWEQAPEGGHAVTVSRSGGSLAGGIFDLNATPDLLPAAAAVAAYARGDTVLTNVAHARIKETDRIAAMAQGLAQLGVNCTEKSDGLVIHGRGGLAAVSPAGGSCLVDSHGDHRIAMALAAAALGAQTPVEIDGAQCVAVTYPGFFDLFESV